MSGYSEVQKLPNTPPGAVEVLPLVERDYSLMTDIPVYQEFFKALRERSDYGFNKYGARLHVPNGRDFDLEVIQELLDAVVYARGAIVAAYPFYGAHALPSNLPLCQEDLSWKILRYNHIVELALHAIGDYTDRLERSLPDVSGARSQE